MITGEPRPALTAEQYQFLSGYELGANILATEGDRVRAGVELMSSLSTTPAEPELLEAATDFATAPETPALDAFETLPLIQGAIEPFNPKQTDETGAVNQRYTMDWKAVTSAINERAKEDSQVQARLTDWFLGTGAALVETKYAPSESRRPLHIVTGGANDQPNHRAFLALASMATPEFRAEHGLETLEDHTLKGEDAADFGWLHDTELQAEFREHVAERIRNGEIDPKVLVIASGAQGRVLKGAERKVATPYIGRNPAVLYAKRGLTEADNMLGGAMRMFGGDPSTITYEEIPSADIGEQPAKRVSFDSQVGRIEFLATVGSEANILSQVTKADESMPELFEDRDGIYGETTGIYAWAQRAILREAISRIGFNDIPVDMLGLSAHAAGIDRNTGTLIGELTMYLKAIYAVAERAVKSAEHYTKSDIALLSGQLAVNS